MPSRKRARAAERNLKRWIDREETLVPLERVIVKSNDASQDRWIPKDVVVQKYRNGELHYDLTNQQYCVPENGVVPHWMQQYNRAG